MQWNHADITLVTSMGGTVLSTHTYPLSAVPYALYAKNADTAIYADSVNLTVVNNFIQSSGYLTDELQVLSISNDTIYLSKGGRVKLPEGFSGDYNDLINVPTDLVHDASYKHTDNNYTTAEKNKLAGIEAGAEVNVQSDWNVTDQNSDAFILHKPNIPTTVAELTDADDYAKKADNNTFSGKKSFQRQRYSSFKYDHYSKTDYCCTSLY